MSTNCIRCVASQRTGGDLLCDDCRSTTARAAFIKRLGYGVPIEPAATRKDFIYKSEGALRDAARDYFKTIPRLIAVKTHGNPYMPVGVADYHVDYAGRSVWIELKERGNYATPMQLDFLTNAAAAGAVVGVADTLNGVHQLLCIAANDAAYQVFSLSGMWREFVTPKGVLS